MFHDHLSARIARSRRIECNAGGWVALGAAAVPLAAGSGAAYAYTSAGALDVSNPQGYFTFCIDRQRDVAGISVADLAGDNNGGLSYQIENVSYPNTAPLETSLPTSHPFVRNKSGIAFSDAGTPGTGDDVRRVIVTTYVEYDDATMSMPTQVRCKMRTQESLNKPLADKQRFDDPHHHARLGRQAATPPAERAR